MRRRGHTLIEQVVVCALFALSVTVIFGLFEYGHRLLRGGDARNDCQRQAMQFVSRFQREFASCKWATVRQLYASGSPSQGDLAVSWLSHLDNGGQPVIQPGAYRPIFQAWVIYCIDQTSQSMRRFRLPLARPTLSVSSMPAADLLAALPTGGFEVQANQAVSWQALDYVSQAPTDLVQSPALFQITTQTPQSAPYRLEFRVKLLN